MLAPRMPMVPLESPMKRRRMTRLGSNLTTSSVVATLMLTRSSGVNMLLGCEAAARCTDCCPHTTISSSNGSSACANAAPAKTALTEHAVSKAICIAKGLRLNMLSSPFHNWPQPATTGSLDIPSVVPVGKETMRPNVAGRETRGLRFFVNRTGSIGPSIPPARS